MSCGAGSLGPFTSATYNDDHFPDPFYDYASMSMPRTIKDAHRLCEFLVLSNGPYREAISRVVSYFITDVEVLPKRGVYLDQSEIDKYVDFFESVFDVRTILPLLAVDYITYGNSITSLTMPFRRSLRPACGCRYEMTFDDFHNNARIKPTWSDFTYSATCLRCNRATRWTFIDRRSKSIEDLQVTRWSPHFIDIDHDDRSNESRYIWRIPNDYRQQLRDGNLLQVKHADAEILNVVQNNQDLEFASDVIYHMREQPPAGVRNRGWGFSRVLTNFRHAYYYAVLHRYNEAIALDYVIPFRLITPAPRGGATGESSDPVLSLRLGDFRSQVLAMLRRRRQSPTSWNVLPTPVQYQALGGEAKQLAPRELLEFALKTLLDAIGVPFDLYTATLSAQAAPAALRLFEANWSHLISALNKFLQFVADRVAELQSWEPVRVKLRRVTHADDLNKQMAMLQLMMSGNISQSTGLAALNLDYVSESRRKLEEERQLAELTAKAQEDMEGSDMQRNLVAAMSQSSQAAPGMPQMQGMPGAMPAGGVPTAASQSANTPGVPQTGMAGAFAASTVPTPNQSFTVEELVGLAATIAQQMMSLPTSIKNSQLAQLRKQNEALALLVSAQVDRLKRDAELRGREMILQQEYGAGQ